MVSRTTKAQLLPAHANQCSSVPSHANSSMTTVADTPPPRLFEKSLTVDELLNAMHGTVSKWTVYRWVKSGLPVVKLGGQLHFEPSKAFPWIERKVRR